MKQGYFSWLRSSGILAGRFSSLRSLWGWT